MDNRYYNRLITIAEVPPPSKRNSQVKSSWKEKLLITLGIKEDPDDKWEIEGQLPGGLNFWISPAGKTIPMEIAEHESWAKNWLMDNWGTEKVQEELTRNGLKDFSQILEDHGWIRVMNWHKKNVTFISSPGRKKFPKHQVKAMVDICIDAGIPVPNTLKET